jgi:hypothetical protein
MHLHKRVILTLALGAAAVLAAAGTATAASGSISPGGAITSASLGGLTFDSSVVDVICPLTLVGTLASGVIEKREGAHLGSISQVIVNNPACQNGSVGGILGLPWELTYDSIEGTLPDAVTALRFTINNVQFLVNATVIGLTAGCLYQGNANARLAASGSNPYVTGLAASLANSINLFRDLNIIPVCPTTGRLVGTFGLSPQQTVTRL